VTAHTDEEFEALALRLEAIRAHAPHHESWRLRHGWWRCMAWECVVDAGLPDSWGPYLLHVDYEPRGTRL
jgi:hypothetical protein